MTTKARGTSSESESHIVHGGRLDRARRMFPNAPQPWIDLSTGVSPFPYPLPLLPPEAFTRLPDADALAELERIAARTYGVGEGAAVVAGAGSQAFIQLLPRLRPSRRVLILGFTYEEHAAAWRAAGAFVERASTLDELESADVAIIVNPNNPDGRLETRERLAATAARMASRGSWLIVDEAFMDMLGPAQSLAPLAGAEGVVILRSFGKAYGLPGLRLGFALCEAGLGELIRERLGPWSVSGPAIAVGAAALADEAWLAARAGDLRQSGERLDALLRSAGFEPVGGAPLFRLVRHEQAARWFAHLGRCGILTRAFGERPDWLRFGLPGTAAAWERLAWALESGHGV
jgi:cobalamin biosynthetic protein CobC